MAFSTLASELPEKQFTENRKVLALFYGAGTPQFVTDSSKEGRLFISSVTAHLRTQSLFFVGGL